MNVCGNDGNVGRSYKPVDAVGAEGLVSRLEWGLLHQAQTALTDSGCGGATRPVREHSKPGVKHLCPGGSRPENKGDCGTRSLVVARQS
jgi:hypothetical protein